MMKQLRLFNIGVILLSSFAWGSAQHGRGGGHMGGSPSSAGGSERSQAGHEASNSNRPEPRSPEQLLKQNTKLSSNLQKLLPAGIIPQQACSGFRNLGQCVAAIHVSHNLGISFSDLKAKMTGPNSQSLGKAIHDLRPGANAGAEKKRAEKQAKDDMRDSNS